MALIWFIVLPLAAAVGGYIAIPYVAKVLLRRRFLDTVRESGVVCLTFDDGPNPRITPQVLSLLEDAGVKASFFVLGENADKYPSLVRAILEGGHEIGDHSYWHAHPWRTGPYRSTADAMAGARAVRRYLSPEERAAFRPPYGKLNLFTLMYVLLARRRLVFWDVNPKDYACDSAEQVAENVTKALCPGRVVLLHDGIRNAREVSMVTVGALRMVLEECNRRKLTVTSVGEALSRSGGSKSATCIEGSR